MACQSEEALNITLPSVLKTLATPAEPEKKNLRILEAFSEPYRLVSLPSLDDACKQVRIADLDKYLKEKKRASATYEEWAAFVEHGGSDEECVPLDTPKARDIPPSPSRPASWSLEQSLTDEQLHLMPRISPRKKSEGSISDAMETYMQALTGYRIAPMAPLPIFGPNVEIMRMKLCTPHCQALCEALDAGPTVRKLLVRNNEVCDYGVALLIQKGLTSPLEVLEIDDAPLGKMSMKAFDEAKTSLLSELTVMNAGIGGVLGTWDSAEEPLAYIPCDIDTAAPAEPQDLHAVNMPASPVISRPKTDTAERDDDSECGSSSGSHCSPTGKASLAHDWKERLEPTGLIGKPLFGIIARAFVLSYVDLSQNAFCTAAWQELTAALGQASELLETLKLDWCRMTDACSDAVGTALGLLRNLRILSLRGTLKIEEKNATQLLYVMADHGRLAHVDLRDNPTVGPLALSDLLRGGLCLVCVHFNWNPDLAASQTMAEEMDWSYEDYGHVVAWRALHMKGMSAWRIASDKIEANIFIEGCWVCQQCVTHEITWDSTASGSQVTPTVFIVASWRKWRRIPVPRSSVTASRIVFSTEELVPPGDENYYFFEGSRGFMCAADQPSVPTTVEVRSLFTGHGFKVPTRMNTIQHKLTPFKIPEESVEGDEALKKIGSLFKRPETQNAPESLGRKQLLRQCYERDIECMDFSQLCNVQQEGDLKRLIWSRYTILHDVFMMYQGRAISKSKKGCIDMSMVEVHVFMNELTQTYKASTSVRFAMVDVGELVALVARRTDGTVTRAAFWEFIIRLSVQVYADRPVHTALATFVDHFVPCLRAGALQPFPRHLMYLSEVHGLFFDYRDTVTRAYNSFASDPLMFAMLARSLRLYGKSFNSKHCGSLFALSKDPAPSNRPQTKLTIAEFQEALARLMVVRQQAKLEKKHRDQSPSDADSWHSSQPVTPRPLTSGVHGAALFRLVVRLVIERNAVEINKTRLRAFISRLESLLRLLAEKQRENIIRLKGDVGAG